MKNVTRVLLAGLIVLAFSSPVTQAYPTHERDYAYYDGCDGLIYRGSANYGCHGVHSYDGVQNGRWMLYRETECATGNVVQYAYEWCNGWKLVSMDDAINTRCSC